MIAQLAVQYQNQGCNIDLEVTNDRGVPDLHIDGRDLDIKTIVTPAINHPNYFVRFSKSVRIYFQMQLNKSMLKMIW